MGRPIGYSAFLKLLELLDSPRKTELKKKLGGGGGFQYWRPLQIVVPKAILPAAHIEYLKQDIDQLCSGHQRNYNKNAFRAFCNWIKGKTIKPIDYLPTIDVPLGNSGLIIRLKPDVCFELGGNSFSMNLWATTKPLLSANTLSVGLLFCSEAYNAEGYESHQHLILDTTKNQLFRQENIVPNAAGLLANKIDAFKRDWEALTSMSPPEKTTNQPGVPKKH